MEPHDANAASGRMVHGRGGVSRYFFFFAMQTIGAAILIWLGVPLYRQVLENPGAHEPRPERLIWSLAAIALLQAGYWVRHRLNPPLPRLSNAFLGHIILFLGRLSFVFAAAVFGFAFIRKPEFQIPLSRYLVLIACLFALFCYTQELERLGRGLIGSNPRPDSG